jgi:hypothetical protein
MADDRPHRLRRLARWACGRCASASRGVRCAGRARLRAARRWRREHAASRAALRDHPPRDAARSLLDQPELCLRTVPVWATATWAHATLGRADLDPDDGHMFVLRIVPGDGELTALDPTGVWSGPLHGEVLERRFPAVHLTPELTEQLERLAGDQEPVVFVRTWTVAATEGPNDGAEPAWTEHVESARARGPLLTMLTTPLPTTDG